MILTDKEIRQLCQKQGAAAEKGNLICPFDESALQSESYDISIGEEVSILKKDLGCINLDDQQTLDSLYDVCDLLEEGYVVSPKEYVLVSLKERINLPNNLNAHIRPRTKFTRLGLLLSAQNCNSTYSGVLRVGIFNAANFPIRITPGMRIGQVVFNELKSIPSAEKLYENLPNSSYQNETEFRGPKFANEYEEIASGLVDKWLGRGK